MIMLPMQHLKSQHIADEVKEVDDEVTKNSSDIFSFESRLKQKEDLTTELEREASILEEIITFCLSQSQNHTTEMEELLILGYQQEYIMTVEIMTCFLLKMIRVLHQRYQIKITGSVFHLKEII